MHRSEWDLFFENSPPKKISKKKLRMKKDEIFENFENSNNQVQNWANGIRSECNYQTIGYIGDMTGAQGRNKMDLTNGLIGNSIH